MGRQPAAALSYNRLLPPRERPATEPGNAGLPSSIPRGRHCGRPFLACNLLSIDPNSCARLPSVWEVVGRSLD